MRTARRSFPSPGTAVFVCTVVAMLGALAPPATAQETRPDTVVRNAVRVSGQVVDRESGDPVPGARVALEIGGPGARSRSIEADSVGTFAFDNLEAGVYALRIERLGYRDLSDTVQVRSGGETVITASLVPAALDLEPLVVTAVRRVPYFMRDFERRRAAGIGSFLTREEIEDRHAFLASDLFRLVPGIRIIPGDGVNGARLLMRSQCQPKLYLDGVPEFNGISIDQVVRPVDIEAIEVYSTSGVPPRFRADGCGVVLVWTRVPQQVNSDTSFWKRLAILGGLVLGGFILVR